MKMTSIPASLVLGLALLGSSSALGAQGNRSADCAELKGAPLAPMSPDARVVDLAGFDRFVEAHPSALDFLTDEAFEAFRASLEFNERGLTTFRYDVLKEALTVTEYAQVLGLFGLHMGNGRDVAGDFLEDHKCIGDHTCEEQSNKACTSSC